jgi:NAD(P)-dependent dehydrogenase (short-subunit alcohol dehydrogenase family)
MSQANQVALIIGASGAIGSALGERLSKKGIRLALASRSLEKLEALKERCPEAVLYEVDATKPQEVNALVERVRTELGIPTQLAVCVGSILLKPIHLLTDEEWIETLNLNLNTSFYFLRACTTLWVRNPTQASAVFCSSAAAAIGLSNHEAIGAAKAGLEGLVRSAAATYASRGIRVNAVAPGLVRSSLSAKITQSEGALKASLSLHPVKRVGEPGDVASALEWLLSPEQSWVTGQILAVDGGLSQLKTLG